MTSKFPLFTTLLFFLLTISTIGKTQSNPLIEARTLIDSCLNIHDFSDSKNLLFTSLDILTNRETIKLTTNQESNDYLIALGDAYAMLGNLYANNGQLDSAILFNHRAVQSLQPSDNTHDLAVAHNNLGVLYDYSGNKKKSLEQFSTGLIVAQTNNNEEALALIYGNIGDFFSKEAHYDRALEYHNMALDLQHKTHDTVEMAMSHNYIGLIHLMQEQYPEARKSFHKSLSLSQEIHQLRNQGRSYGCLGRVMTKLDILDSALFYFTRELEITVEMNEPHAICVSEINISEFYWEAGNPEQSLAHLLHAFNLAREIEFPDFIENASTKLSVLYEAKRDFENAVYYRSISDSIIETTNRNDYKRQLIEQEMNLKFEFERERIKLNSEKQLAISNTTHAGEKRILYILIVASLILISFGFYLFKQKQQLAKSKFEIERLHKIELSHRLDQKLKELTSFSIRLSQKNKHIYELESLLDDVEKTSKQNSQEALESKLYELRMQLKNSTRIDNSWNDFQTHFEGVHKNFAKNLKNKFPALTSNEIRLCSLMKLNIPTTDLCNLLGVSSNTLNSSRYRIHKKMNLTKGEKLQDYLFTFE